MVPGLEKDARFTTTHWSLVLAAGGTDAGEARPAMARLLERYWFPLYAFVRRKGHGPEEACDLTQEFLSRLLDRNALSLADPERGRFRTFLLTALHRFLIDEWRREGRRSPRGDRTVLSLDVSGAEERYRLEPADPRTPESIYERRWALALLEGTLARLREESAAAGREALLSAVEPVLAGDGRTAPYAEIAARLDMTEGALKTAIHRLRRRFAAILRAEIAETVARPEDVEDEVQHLFRCLRSP